LDSDACGLDALDEGEDSDGDASGAGDVSLPMVRLRAFLLWLVIIAAETVQGILRGILLVPIVGDLLARQIGVRVFSELPPI
jgi:hypothetical protein